MIEDIVLKASRLVYKGLQPRISPEKDPEYKELCRLCLSSREFSDTVDAIAEGLSLTVVYVSDRGIILTPSSTESRFAMGLTEYRKELEGDQDTEDREKLTRRGLIALVQIAIAATFYPTAEALDDDDYDAGHSASLTDIHQVLVSMSERISKETEDEELIAPSVLKASTVVLSLPEARPDGKIPTLKSRYGAIQIVLNQLVQSGLVHLQETSDGKRYNPMFRYQQLLRRRANGRLFEICHSLAEEANQEIREEKNV